MGNSQVHLVKASFLAQFKTAMENCGASPHSYLKRVKLPLQITDPESLLPIAPFYQLINMFAIEEDIPNFGSLVAQTTPWHRVVSLGPLIGNSHNLRSLLEEFCRVSVGQSSSVNFRFSEDAGDCRFCYTNSLDYAGDVQMEFYRLTSMVQLIQLATGADWRPDTIRLLMPANGLIQSCSLLNASHLIFSEPVSSISILPEELEMPVHMEISRSARQPAITAANQHIDYISSVRQIIDSYALTSSFSIEDLAQVNRQSVRTVQRRLKAAGLSFHQLLGESKFKQAARQLREGETPIAEVARMMGYSDPAHFTRAFRRWAGVPPSIYLKQNRHP